ncbi:hypothetical protein C823_001260 [Eubacterium plexicaudatum ASF492]|uniref:Uncharacterized protein n=1 Tax=Eubacterium plexicaudatum ASF492 TaxID=1235802 RepID=N2B4G8_9FIRM|nr:hypothetical protein C823_007496 [Eubacterium plexicaudatum ASF492]KAI4446742.1 hypothetical protein C823_001260 [Eubacterium plexicaudatum ASF492]
MEYQKTENMTFSERIKDMEMQTNETEDDILAYIKAQKGH